MMNLKRILFPTDFSRCADQAMTHALLFATKHTAELHMLHALVIHDYDPNNPERSFPELHDDIADQLEEFAAEQMAADVDAGRAKNITIKEVCKRGISVAPVILNYAAAENMDLIIMGTHGRRGLGHLFLGSVTEEVVRHAECPVLTVREQKDPKPLEAVERILVPVDFSEPSRTALVYAKEIAASYQARLDLLHVIEQSIHPSFYAIGKTSILDLAPDLDDRAEQEMRKQLREAAGPDVPAETFVIEGRANGDIVKFAESHGSDLIVIASHGLTGIEKFLIGSTTQKVVRRAPCPVFTVKAFGKSVI